jgi:hypothetical protein
MVSRGVVTKVIRLARSDAPRMWVVAGVLAIIGAVFVAYFYAVMR